MDGEGNEFPISLMVIKEEYLTQNDRTQNKGVYLFQYYRLSASIYHFMNSVIGTNLQI
jgi:hypothetical protein